MLNLVEHEKNFITSGPGDFKTTFFNAVVRRGCIKSYSTQKINCSNSFAATLLSSSHFFA